MNKVLIIDDDKDLCILLKKSISIEQLEADYCHSGKDGLTALSKQDYQLVVLDVMMPGIDGFETMEQIRKYSSIPILMLTSKSDNYSKVYGLRSGADDYLTKPFEIAEFTARVLSLIRRYTRFNPNNEEPQQLSFQGLLINIDQHTVTTDGEPIMLPPKEFDVLLFCARHQGKILTKQQIYEAVWGESYIHDDSNIMAIISRLRKKIELDPSSPIYLQTVKGIGYQFNTEV